MWPISSFLWMHPRIKLFLYPNVGCWHRSPLGGALPFYCQNGMYTRQSAFQAGFWVWIPSGEALPGFKPQLNLGAVLTVSRISRGMPMWRPLSILCQFLFPPFLCVFLPQDLCTYCPQLECASFSSSRSLLSSSPYHSLVRHFLLTYSSFGILSILLTYGVPEKLGLKKKTSFFFCCLEEYQDYSRCSINVHFKLTSKKFTLNSPLFPLPSPWFLGGCFCPLSQVQILNTL